MGLFNLFDSSNVRNDMYQVWDGDLFLYSVDTQYEADEQAEAGFTIKSLEYYGA